MGASSPEQITKLLIEWNNGDQAALNELMPLVYDELRRLAHHYMRNERTDHTLQTTALVNEAYLRFTGYKKIRWQNRAHFFALAAQAMRRILVEHARAHNRAKRDGGTIKVTSHEAPGFSKAPSLDVLALDEAMEKLEILDPRKSRVVEMRFYSGMSNEEIAEVLKISENTVMRDWNFAEAWLRRELSL